MVRIIGRDLLIGIILHMAPMLAIEDLLRLRIDLC
jgi:hypothetical protein